MSDTDGANCSDGNGSYIDWLEENWKSFSAEEAPEEVPQEEQPFFAIHPFMGYYPSPMRSTRAYIDGWIRGMKIGLLTTGGVIALLGAWNVLSWFVNAGQSGFGQ